ncbi:MAG: 50S ribosomal protein L25 [Candidatus Dasytiphilus stammeri]
MITIHAIKKPNKHHGKSGNRRLRAANLLPAIIYGGNKESISIILDLNKITKLQNQKEFYNEPLNIIIDGQKNHVKIQEIQHHPFKPLILHVDFIRIE